MNYQEDKELSSRILKLGQRVILIETGELQKLMSKLDINFVNAVGLILRCNGKLIISGMGKSGLIASKIAATFSSTGTPSFFLHPAEAYHGDLGMIEKDDIAFLLSNSGETDEVLKLIPFLQDQGNNIISMTGNPESTLAKNSNCHLNVSVEKEACPLQLAPTSSTTATLVMGDALALTVMETRGFKEGDFARFHPGGSLGRKLVSRVANEMVKKDNLSLIDPTTSAIDTIHAISDSRLGVAIVVDSEKKLIGIITDGDIRRAAEHSMEDFFKLKAGELITPNPHTVLPELRVFDAEKIMDSLKIHQLIVVNNKKQILGILPYRSQLNRNI